jgi:hypothetical protein
MKITCTDLHQFLDVIEGLAQRGLTFAADASRLTVTLLGGF